MKVTPFELPVEEIRASLQALRRPLSVAILRARNPFNVGAIIRVAHSFLVREILLVGDERWYERGAMGMDRYENIVPLPTEADLIAHVRATGRKLVVFEKDAARVDLWHAELPDDCVMLFGSETAGVSRGAAAGRRHDRGHPHVRHQPLVPGHRRGGHRDGRVDPPLLRHLSVRAQPRRRTASVSTCGVCGSMSYGVTDVGW